VNGEVKALPYKTLSAPKLLMFSMYVCTHPQTSDFFMNGVSSSCAMAKGHEVSLPLGIKIFEKSHPNK